MENLNLPKYQLNIKLENNKQVIFDIVRRKFIVLTPEEWVRQNFVHYLIHDKGFAMSLLSVEHSLKLNSMNRRADIVAFNRKAQPWLIVECKATSVQISQSVFDQIARYNITLRVPYLIVTNGLSHYCCHIDFENNSYSFLNEIPNYSDISE